MQVLFKGTPGEQEYTATCSHCNSTMKFSRKEVKSAFNNSNQSKYITCPVCSDCVFESYFVKLPKLTQLLLDKVSF